MQKDVIGDIHHLPKANGFRSCEEITAVYAMLYQLSILFCHEAIDAVENISELGMIKFFTITEYL
jgi:hypothetical protein